MASVRIAQAQINVTVGDFAGNLSKIVHYIQQAREASADVVTFPELALCGYPPEDLLLKPRFLRDNHAALEMLLPHCAGITVTVGFADSDERHAYNAAALIHNCTLVDIYHKVELPNYGVFDEKRYFQPGMRCVVFEIDDVRFSLTVCEDIWIPGSVTELFARDNRVDAVLSINGSPFYAGKLAVRHEIVDRFARVTNATVFYNNLVGGQDELVFDGGCLVVDPNGELIALGPRFKEQLLLVDLDTGPVPRQRLPQLVGKGRGLHHLKALGRSPRRRVINSISPQVNQVEEIYDALVLGTRDYVRKNGFQKVVMGLSGGIDSSLTAAIAVEALGAENVIGVTMPSQYTSKETLSDAEVLAGNLGIKLITVPIREILQGYLTALAEPFGGGSAGVTEENLQARIRGNILMGLSNRFGWLVITTGNKSETAVGYCTLYGDMAGGFAMIKDVPKTVVYDLSEFVNVRARTELIPRSVIKRPPTAELRPDQRDEDSLPPYSVLDPILKAYVEEDKSAGEISAQGFDPRTVEDVVRMVDRNEYKRRQAPPGIKITPRAFGKDWRLPITNRYNYCRR